MKIFIFIVSLISSICGLTAAFTMFCSDDAATQSEGHLYLFLGVVMLGVSVMSGIDIGGDIIEQWRYRQWRSRRSFRG